MCLAIPRKVLEVYGSEVVLDYGGEKKKAKVLFEIKKGDYVIVNGGIVVEKVSKEEAENCKKLIIMDSE